MERLPKHMRQTYGTLRGFRQEKRRQVRQALLDLKGLQQGCAYTPAYRRISDAIRAITEAKDLMSVKRWDRNGDTPSPGD